MPLNVFASILTLAAFPLLVMSQTSSQDIRAKLKKPFQMEDLIYGGATYFQRSVPENRYMEWWGDELVRLDLDRAWRVDKSSGRETELFTLERLGMPELRHLYYVSFPYAGETLALVTLPRERRLIDWTSGRAVWSQPADSAGSDADWSAASRHLAFVKGHNLYVTTSGGETLAVTADGSLDVEYGISVHRNEFGIEKGTFWSDDGQKLAFYRMDQTDVSAYPQVSIDGAQSTRCAQLVPDKYPMAGETSHKVTVGIYDVGTRQTRYLDLGDPTDRYFTNLAWAPDGRTLYLIELNRDQNRATLDAYDAASGQKLATLLTLTDEKYVEPQQPVRFLPWDASQFILASRQDGWNHLYLYRLDKDGRSCRLQRQLTRGEWEVMDFCGFDRAHRRAVYTSNEQDPIGCAAWAVDMKGRRLALGGASGWHTPQLSAATGGWLADNWSAPDVARRIDLVDNTRGRALQLADMQDPWGEYRVPDIRVGTLKAADGATDLYYRLVLPTDFDSTQRYPAVVYVYGGPHAHLVQASRHWGVGGWDVWMAQQGYVVFTLDNRGSSARRRCRTSSAAWTSSSRSPTSTASASACTDGASAAS